MAKVSAKIQVGRRGYDGRDSVDDNARNSGERRSSAGAGIVRHGAVITCASHRKARTRCPALSKEARARTSYRSPGTVPAKAAPLSTELAKAEPAEAGNSEMSAGERLRIQSALLWSGDYTGSLGGEDPFRSAVRNFHAADIEAVIAQGAVFYFPVRGLFFSCSNRARA
jgi:hypothetical protein